MARALYVETSVRVGRGGTAGTVDDLWHLTQDPALHPRWDLRFSAITPTGTDDEGHRLFRYDLALPAPRLPLVTVTGTGVSTASRRRADGGGTSALRWGAAGPLSPLGAGSGYWRYVPDGGRVRFLTGYDYEPGWGRLGRWLDPWLVRPLVGRATAWSFDRLRLWAERGLDPARARDAALALAAARAGGLVGAGALARRAVRHRSGAPAVAAALVVTASVLAPAPPGVPSARRCRRRPPDRLGATPPRDLAGLPLARAGADR